MEEYEMEEMQEKLVKYARAKYLEYRDDYKRRNGSVKNVRKAWLRGGWKRFSPELLQRSRYK